MNQLKIKLPTPEELAEMSKRHYENVLLKNKNNFSFWYPKITEAPQVAGLHIPKSTIIQVPLEMIDTLVGEEIRTHEGDEFINKVVLPIATDFLKGVSKNELFVKNAVFSDKFNFNEACHATLDNLVQSIKLINYDAACLGAEGSNEIVLRDFIYSRATSLLPTIYNGMPLRTEFRLFYNFDKKCVVVCLPYWDEAYLLEHLSNEDHNVFKAYSPKLKKDFELHKETVTSKTEDFLRNVLGLTGVWSIDIMLDGGTYYLIDMAEGPRSAYWDPSYAE